MNKFSSTAPLEHTKSTRNPDAQEVDYFDDDSPDSLISLLPARMAERLVQIPPKYFTLSEQHLEKKASPSEIEIHLRINFWSEYLLATDKKRRMDMGNVYRGICSREFFYREVITNDEKLAYIVTPRKDFKIRMEQLLDILQDQMMEIVQLPNKNGRGDPNTRLIAEKVKIFQLTIDRVKGTVVNRVASMHMNVASPEAQNLTELSAEEELLKIEAQIAELRQKDVVVLPPEARMLEHERTPTDEGRASPPKKTRTKT